MRLPGLALCGSSGRAGTRAGARRHFAGAVAAARRLPCGARSPRRAHEFAPENTVAQTVCARPRDAGQPRSAVLLSAPEARRHAPTRVPACTSDCLSGPANSGGSKAGVDGAAALSIAAQRGESAVRGGPARRIYAAARSAPLRSHRSRPAKREAQGTRSEAKGAASKLLRPSAPALPRPHQHAIFRCAPRLKHSEQA